MRHSSSRETQPLKAPSFTPVAQPARWRSSARPEGGNPARGVVFGLALSLPFWLMVALAV